jgi:hypothetical protein
VSDTVKLSSGTVTTCHDRFQHRDGSVTVEKLWVFFPKGYGERRFLGLCVELNADDACAKVQS